MKHFWKITVAFLILLLLASCSGGTESEETTDSATDTPSVSVTESVQETEPPFAGLTLVEKGASEYILVSSSKASTAVEQCLRSLRAEIKGRCGVLMDMESDASVKAEESPKEILIGETNRPESIALAKDCNKIKHGYAVRVENGKLVFWASDAEMLQRAVDLFTMQILTGKTVTVDEDYSVVWDLCGEGMPMREILDEYTIVYPAGLQGKEFDAAAEVMREIFTLTGKTVKTSEDKKKKDHADKEILIGFTDREESASVMKELNHMDYTVRMVGDKLVILGGCPFATLNAARAFLKEVAKREENLLSEDVRMDYDFDVLIEDSLIHRLDSFVPVWAKDFTPADWMLNYEEKLYALVSPTGRMTADAHRGDVQNYPENSLEGIYSAILMGCDVVEIDIRLTKDNVMVLMHDATLTRMTNVDQLKGKNGLPSSVQIADWTYEQLLKLNLKFNGAVTKYKIPTLYEVVSLFPGKSQIHFDCKVTEIDRDTDVFQLADALGAKESFFYYYGINVMRSWVRMDEDDTEFAAFVTKMEGYLSRSGHALRKRNFDLIAKYGDIPDGWHQQYASGCRMIFTNKIYDFCRYIAENEGPVTP